MLALVYPILNMLFRRDDRGGRDRGYDDRGYDDRRDEGRQGKSLFFLQTYSQKKTNF